MWGVSCHQASDAVGWSDHQFIWGLLMNCLWINDVFQLHRRPHQQHQTERRLQSKQQPIRQQVQILVWTQTPNHVSLSVNVASHCWHSCAKSICFDFLLLQVSWPPQRPSWLRPPAALRPRWEDKMWLTVFCVVYICLLLASDSTIFGQTALMKKRNLDFIFLLYFSNSTPILVVVVTMSTL